MSIASKKLKIQKKHEHSNKHEKHTALPEPPPEDILPFWAPALGNIASSHAHTASPRPLARTHDTKTKRNRNRFPDWVSTASIISPQSPREPGLLEQKKEEMVVISGNINPPGGRTGTNPGLLDPRMHQKVKVWKRFGRFVFRIFKFPGTLY